MLSQPEMDKPRNAGPNFLDLALLLYERVKTCVRIET